MNKEEQNYILNYCLENGIKDIADVDIDVILNMKKRQEVLAKNKSEPWLGKDGYWRAYVQDDSKPKGRRLVKKKNKKDLEDEIIKSIELNEKVTIGDLFEEYLERKKEIDKIQESSINVYRQVFDRHFIKTGWSKKDITKVTPEDLCEFLEDECGINNLTPRSFCNLKTITKGILKRATRRKLINYTYSMVTDNIEVTAKKRSHSANEEVFTLNELGTLIKYFSDRDNRDIQNLALLLMTLTGIRIGEAVTLTYDDFMSDTAALVHRTEVKYKVDGKTVYDVKDTPKTEAGVRTIFIPAQFAWIIKEMRKLRPFATFLCTDEKGKRMTTNCLRMRFTKVLKKLGIKHRSPHKLRKTYCTIILDHGFDSNLVTSIMGHTDIRTSEQFYHFDRKTNLQKQEMVNNIKEFKIS